MEIIETPGEWREPCARAPASKPTSQQGSSALLAGHLAPARAEYVQAFAGVNFNAEKISGALFEISGALSKALATRKFSGPLFEV